MYIKRLLCVLIVMLLALTPLALSEEEAARDEATLQAVRYEHAMLLMDSGELQPALTIFAELGDYKQSADYSVYLTARLALGKHNPNMALGKLEGLGDFADSADWVTYIKNLCLHRFYEDGKFGYMDLDGNVLYPAQWDWAERTPREESLYRDEGFVVGMDSAFAAAVVYKGAVKAGEDGLMPDGGGYGLVSSDGRLLLDTVWQEIVWVNNGIAAVSDGNSVSLIDLATDAVIGAVNEALVPGDGDIITCRLGDKWGFVNRDGSILAGGFSWDNAGRMVSGRATVYIGKEAGLIDDSGRVIVSPQYQALGEAGDGLIAFRLGNRWGYMDLDGSVVLPRAYSAAQPFHLGVAGVKRGDNWGVIDKYGKLLLPGRYTEIIPVETESGRGWMRLNKRWGVYDKTGKIIVKPSYTERGEFGLDGLARVADKTAYGFIDKQGTKLIALDYLDASDFRAGRGGVLTADGEVRYIARLGGRYFTIESDKPYDCILGFIEGIRKTSAEGEAEEYTYTVYDVSGNVIAPAK